MKSNHIKVSVRVGSNQNGSLSFFSKTRSALGAILIAGCLVGVVFGYATAKSNKSGDIDIELTNIEKLGKYVFFDKISSPKRMGCVTCHDPKTGGTGSVAGVNLHQVAITGANPHTIGNLKPPTNAYATFIGPLAPCNFGVPGWCGGNFWNSRSEGNEWPPQFPEGAAKHLGEEVFYKTDGTPLPDDLQDAYSLYFGPTADQALNPMPNPVEQNIDRKAVCQHVKSAKYAPLYKLVWGVDIDCSDTPVAVSAPDMDPLVNTQADPSLFPEKAFDISFKRIMLAVCAWQASPDLNSFSSRRDIELRNDEDGLFPLDGFTDEENLGHDLFYGVESALNPDGKSAGCAGCHSDNPGADTGEEPEQLYSDDGFHNIGVPRNPEIPPTYNADGTLIDPDLGLAGLTGVVGDPLSPGCTAGGFRRNCDHRGFHKTTTLRNVNKRKGEGFTKAYTHNGWFKSMESIVHFYNTGLIGGPTADSFGITRCPDGIETERDALANNCWPAPAYANPLQPGSPTFGAVLGGGRFGDLGLTLEEEAAIVAYLKTFTDTHTAKAPKPYK
ncbi:cytochrome-c peroxidase [Desulfococcus multivorans]|uniref:Di-heme cytochrome c peroxidase n=1 Tax=Desulfococcus multivorans DSM 2059 TaxID=1121405 RepID=S7TGQ3_DESML|nr:cytochrome c peroxidase [Desulfococcus multivorans]AOY59974.1 conserved uncharacterized protein [Desulfococcus multivorans]EPR35971.1 Di-heme cytochrome c peroxidase [Desulfococcus multivorans DSM 2059]SJZ36045.1 Cytochrome c peroxidase [Desulfococcus multivorans DSM 2059]